MSLKKQMESGQVYVEFGHASQADREYEQIIAGQRRRCKALCFAYNQTSPMDDKRKDELLNQLLGSVGEALFMEAPIHFAYGINTHVGDHVYANFNLTVVDDCRVDIGSYVMFAPNVTITATGHPVHPMFRDLGAQFSLPVTIKDHVWIGANTVILPGVTIGENSVIGAGSVVTHDIPANTVAMGVPCRPTRAITEEDRLYARKGVRVNDDWNR